MENSFDPLRFHDKQVSSSSHHFLPELELDDTLDEVVVEACVRPLITLPVVVVAVLFVDVIACKLSYCKCNYVLVNEYHDDQA